MKAGLNFIKRSTNRFSLVKTDTYCKYFDFNAYFLECRFRVIFYKRFTIYFFKTEIYFSF
jgi:hypothetical protein